MFYWQKKWDVSERSVRNYCAHGRVAGAFITGKTWNIPENAKKPERSNKKKEKTTTLLDILLDEKANKYSGGIYHKTQIDLTYNLKCYTNVVTVKMQFDTDAQKIQSRCTPHPCVDEKYSGFFFALCHNGEIIRYPG